jgi:putative ABC transport system substrate-binding protein
MRRRDFITLLGATAATWPLATRAQQTAMTQIGFLGSGTPEGYRHFAAAFRRGLNETGYVEGQNIAVEYRWAEGQYERLPTLAADLVRHQVALIVASGGPAARAAKASTTTIPIVFVVGVDPAVIGLVTSINQPGGNATGVSVIARELDAKRLELLHELLPTATVIAVLLNPANPSYGVLSGDIKGAASRLGVQILALDVRTERDLDTVFAKLLQEHVDGLVVTDEPFFNSQRIQLVSRAARHRIPTIYPWREYAEAGGLISHGTSLTDTYRQVGIYAGRILKGAKPSDLPVLEPTKFETVLNLKTAKALGLDVPTAILLRADEVIE